MEATKKERLEAAGWKVGSVDEFLGESTEAIETEEGYNISIKVVERLMFKPDRTQLETKFMMELARKVEEYERIHFDLDNWICE